MPETKIVILSLSKDLYRFRNLQQMPAIFQDCHSSANPIMFPSR